MHKGRTCSHKTYKRQESYKRKDWRVTAAHASFLYGKVLVGSVNLLPQRAPRNTWEPLSLQMATCIGKVSQNTRLSLADESHGCNPSSLRILFLGSQGGAGCPLKLALTLGKGLPHPMSCLSQHCGNMTQWSLSHVPVYRNFSCV